MRAHDGLESPAPISPARLISHRPPMPRVLGIETSGTIGSVALWDDALVAEESFQRGLVHGKVLVPTIEALLARAQWERSTIGLIAVSQGPGSYTGVRVGVATAKALAWTLGCPIVGVPTLDAMARNPSCRDVPLCPVVDARWEQVYTGLYAWRGDVLDCLSGPRAVRPEALARELPGRVHLFGDGLRRYGAAFERPGVTFGVEEEWVCRARLVAELGARAFAEGKRDEPISLVPLYLRPTEAELKQGKA